LVLASDKLAALHEPAVRLSLTTSRGSDTAVTMELSKGEMDTLLTACAAAQQALDTLKD